MVVIQKTGVYNESMNGRYVIVKLSEKIVELRKQYGMTQEQLAEICGVSRQSISKWEADIALPEIDKILILGETFHVSLDVLIKDDLAINEVKVVHQCGKNALQEMKQAFYEGAIIKESLEDDKIIDLVNVHKVELWNVGGTPNYWTVLFFTSENKDFPKAISKAIKQDETINWFVDFKANRIKYIVFRDRILSYVIGNQEQKACVCEECRKLGIPDEQMNWSE